MRKYNRAPRMCGPLTVHCAVRTGISEYCCQINPLYEHLKNNPTPDTCECPRDAYRISRCLKEKSKKNHPADCSCTSKSNFMSASCHRTCPPPTKNPMLHGAQKSNVHHHHHHHRSRTRPPQFLTSWEQVRRCRCHQHRDLLARRRSDLAIACA